MTVAANPNKIAVSVAAATPGEQLDQLHAASAYAALAEVRLDLAVRFDVERLVRRSPLPLILTCRAAREGGAFAGSERERLRVLHAATAAGAAFIDVEWDARARLRCARGSRTRIIVSRHFTGMPGSLLARYREMRAMGDAVKLVGVAARPRDVLPVLELLRRARSPVIALAMGAAGQLTRLIAPLFASSLLTYGAIGPGQLTAPGQLTIAEMYERYQLHRASPTTALRVHPSGPLPRSSSRTLHVRLSSRAVVRALARSVVVQTQKVQA